MKKKYKIVTCPKCKGEKYILNEKHRFVVCPECEGTGALKVRVDGLAKKD